MVERRKLTADFVNELEPPLKGERWIADTEVRGFGVRLWGGESSGKSFAIRVNDKNGKTVRMTISQIGDDREWLDLRLNFARDIARREIRKLKGIQEPLTFHERMQQEWQLKLGEYSFDELAELAIEVQRRTTNSEQYVDDNWSRYTAYASLVLGMKKAVEVTAEEIIAVLDSLDDKPAQKRNLHSFLNYIFKLAWKLSPDFRETAVGISRDYLRKFETYRTRQYLYDGRLKLKASDFDKLFKILGDETQHIEKADFIKLLFYLGPRVSPRKLLEAQTEDFYITELVESTNPWGNRKEKHQYVYWRPEFKRKKYFEYRIQDEQIDLLYKILERNDEVFAGSPFLFPSKRSPKTGHMTSYKDYWSRIKDDAGLPDMPLRKLIGNYMWACSEHVTVYDPDTIDFDEIYCNKTVQDACTIL